MPRAWQLLKKLSPRPSPQRPSLIRLSVLKAEFFLLLATRSPPAPRRVRAAGRRHLYWLSRASTTIVSTPALRASARIFGGIPSSVIR